MELKTPLKIIFAGTPSFAAVALKELLKTSHQIIAVYTQPDRPSGRGRKLTASAVKQIALEQQLKIFQPETLRNAKAQKELADLQADIMIVAAYGLLLPAEVLYAPRLGCVNIHPSLLPRWRGAAPIQRTILAGDTTTGVCIMQMDEGLDTGPVLYRVTEPVLPQDTAATLHDRLAELGAAALVQTLDFLQNNQIKADIQNPATITYADKFTKEEARIDWQASAIEIDRKIRAFNPWPTAFTTKDGQTFKIWEATLVPGSITTKAPGTIINFSPFGITVATGNGVLAITKLQFAGGKIVTAADVFNMTNSRLPHFNAGEKLDEIGNTP